MQTTIKGGTITTTLTKNERRQLNVAADICESIALVKFEPAATVAADLRGLAKRFNISRNGSSDDQVAADAAETVTRQTTKES